MTVKVYGPEETALREWARASGVSESAFVRQILRELNISGMAVLPKNLINASSRSQ